MDLAAKRGRLLAHADKYLARVDLLGAGYMPAERREHACIVALAREGVLHGLEHGSVSDDAQPWLDAVLRHERSTVTEAEALLFYAMLLELRLESLNDSAGTFLLRIKRLAERRALAAVDAPVTGSLSS